MRSKGTFLGVIGILLIQETGASAQDVQRQVDPKSAQVQDTLMIVAWNRLMATPYGRSLDEELKKQGKLERQAKLPDWIRWDDVSRTDAVLVRHFDPETQIETRERKVTVFLNRTLSEEDLFFDLAHELTHAILGRSWDPYDPELNIHQYIQQTIESPGGEVEAVLGECQAALEWTKVQPQSDSDRIHQRRVTQIMEDRCGKYRTPNGKSGEWMRATVIQEFYQVGRWFEDLKAELGSHSPILKKLSPESPELYSSTGRAPYPVALAQEYREMNAIACRNSRKRLELTKKSARSLASNPKSQNDDMIKNRCANENDREGIN